MILMDDLISRLIDSLQGGQPQKHDADLTNRRPPARDVSLIGRRADNGKNTTDQNTTPAYTPPSPRNKFGSKIGEERTVIIRYKIGEEKDACVEVGSDGEYGFAEDTAAVCYALGSLLSEDMFKGVIPSKLIGDRLIVAAMSFITEHIMRRV